MNLILLDPGDVDAAGIARLTDVRATHIARVLHATPGQQVRIGLTNGPFGLAMVESVEGDAIRWTVPISRTGQATFELTVSYSYCRDGTGGVCKFGTARWRLPVRATAEAPASKVSLKVDPSAN